MRAVACGLVLFLLATGGPALAQLPAQPKPIVGATASPAPLPTPLAPATGDVRPAAAVQVPSAAGTTPDAVSTPPPPGAEAGPPAADTTRPTVDLRDNHLGPEDLLWFRARYLLWWIKNGPLTDALVTTSPPGTPFENAGVPGLPSTTVLLGQSKIDYGTFSGVRLETGAWLDDRHVWGAEAGGLYLGRRTTGATFAGDATGNPILARPIIDFFPVPAVPPFTPNAVPISFPNTFTGAFTFSASSRLWGAEANVARNVRASGRGSFDLLFGFRYLDLQEDLALGQTAQALAGGALIFNPMPGNLLPLPEGSSLSLLDRFHVRNQFYGGQMGGRLEYRMGIFVLNLQGKVAFGPNHESIDVSANTTATTPTGTASLPSGLLALTGTNTGRLTNNLFVVVPEGNFEIGCQLTRYLQIQVGYDFLYVNNVVRAGSQVSSNINTAFVPSQANLNPGIGPALPHLVLPKEDFWAQGIHFGVEFRY